MSRNIVRVTWVWVYLRSFVYTRLLLPTTMLCMCTRLNEIWIHFPMIELLCQPMRVINFYLHFLRNFLRRDRIWFFPLEFCAPFCCCCWLFITWIWYVHEFTVTRFVNQYAVLVCIYMSTCDVRLGQGKILHFHSFVPCECVRKFYFAISFDFALFRLFFCLNFRSLHFCALLNLRRVGIYEFVSVSRVANDSQFNTLEHIRRVIGLRKLRGNCTQCNGPATTWKHTKYTKWPKSMIRTCDKMSKTIDQFDVYQQNLSKHNNARLECFWTTNNHSKSIKILLVFCAAT